jgi:hypothetical protein
VGTAGGAAAGTAGTDDGGGGAADGSGGTAGADVTGGDGSTAGVGGNAGGAGGRAGEAGTGLTGGAGIGGNGGSAGAAGSGVAGSTAGATGMAGVGNAGGTGGASGKAPPPPPGVCDESAVSAACPSPLANPGCTEIYCGERLWRNGAGAYGGLVIYRISDPAGQFSDAYRSAIRTVAQAWADSTEGLVGVTECPGCFGRVVVVVPGTGDGIVDPTQYEQVLPMPVIAGASPPLHVIAHQWGHAMGLGHTYERADRDRYLHFDPAVWCGPGRSGLPPRCAYSPDQPGVPRIASDTFGAFDDKSKMNGFELDGICGSDEPDPTSGLPTDGDGSAVEELYMAHNGGWSPFQPIARSLSPTQPLDYTLAPEVDPVGSPAITEWKPPNVEVFARGTDGSIYTTHNDLFGSVFLQWSPWEAVAADVDADPSAMFEDRDRLHLAVRAHADGSIRLRTRTSRIWGQWSSLGAPTVGTASAPAIAVLPGQPLTVFVLGRDGLIYEFACADPAALCAASSAQPGAWSALPASPTGTFIGKPSAVFLANGDLRVTAVASDSTGWIIGGVGGVDFSNSSWVNLPGTVLAPGDPDPAVALQAYGNDIGLYARGTRGRLINTSPWYFISPLGGVIKSAPGVTAAHDGEPWVHIAAVIEDHRRPGVWLKFYGGFQQACNYNVPGTCAQCGCDIPNGPACSN